MANKQSVGGGGRKIGNHKEHCAKYKTLGIRLRNKIRNFTKHNIPKSATENEVKRLINNFSVTHLT